MINIVPFPNKVFIKPDKTDLGAFEQVDSRVSESGVVTHIGMIGNYTFGLSVGDKVYFKAWGADSIDIDGEKYFVMDIDRRNLLCKIQ